jgi:hypothetical protein
VKTVHASLDYSLDPVKGITQVGQGLQILARVEVTDTDKHLGALRRTIYYGCIKVFMIQTAQKKTIL